MKVLDFFDLYKTTRYKKQASVRIAVWLGQEESLLLQPVC